MDSSNEQFALLSGSCFPLMSTGELNDAVLALNAPAISVWGKIDAALSEGEGLGRFVVTKFHPHDRAILTPKTSRMHERVWDLFKRLNARLPYERKVDLTDLWKGSQFFIIGRECAKSCSHPPANLVRALRYALAPDEILFTTLIVRHIRDRGLPVAITAPDAARQSAHFIIKRVPPKRSLRERMFQQVDLRALAASDADTAVASGAWFARKCSSEVSMAIAARWTGDEATEIEIDRAAA